MREIKLKPKEQRRIAAGHYWIFSNEIDGLDSSADPGELVRVLDSEGNTVGTGFFNPHSLIAVRLVQKGPQPLAEDFIFQNLDAAYEYRKELGVRKYGRMCYGESDAMPGLVVDRYGDVLVAGRIFSVPLAFFNVQTELSVRLRGLALRLKRSAKCP